MVEINNQRKAFLDMLRGRRELITDVRKSEIMVMMLIVGGELFTDYSDHPQTCHAKPKNSNQQAPTLPASFLLVDAYRKQLGLKDFSPKSQDAVALKQIKERGALPMIDRGDIRQQSTVAAISGLHCRALVMVSSEHKADSLIANSKKRAWNGQRD